jgi:hypothetical protein
MGRRFAGVLAVLFAITGCASVEKVKGGPGSSVQLVVPDYVGWDPSGPFEVPLTIMNATGMMLQIAQPFPEAVTYTVYRQDGSVFCKAPKVSWAQVDGWRIKKVRSLNSLSYKLDMQMYCKAIPSGVYRYDVSYTAHAADGQFADVVWTGTLGPIGGRVLVRTGADQMKYDDLVAALDSKDAGVITAADPGTAPPADAAATAPAADPSAVRACVDHELAARGLNAYGDSANTSYPGGPPIDEYGRVLYVAARLPAVRRACGITTF